jgi:hypothetical protein
MGKLPSLHKRASSQMCSPACEDYKGIGETSKLNSNECLALQYNTCRRVFQLVKPHDCPATATIFYNVISACLHANKENLCDIYGFHHPMPSATVKQLFIDIILHADTNSTTSYNQTAMQRRGHPTPTRCGIACGTAQCPGAGIRSGRATQAARTRRARRTRRRCARRCDASCASQD